jgi:saccharopine dehydrogenase (NAD+, L-lysine forming)
MPDRPWLWIRHETRPDEQRAPLVPEDVSQLVDAGLRVTVEESPERALPLRDYVAAGAGTAPAGSWVEAPDDVYVLGLKELPDAPAALRHRHLYFGHAFKGQAGAGALLSRFTAGGGALLDLESLVDGAGRRVAAFGTWAGYAGAALAVLHHRGVLDVPLRPTTRDALDRALVASRTVGRGRDDRVSDEPTRAVVVGALGRSGRGAVAALERAGVATTCWDVAETRDLDRRALLAHDLLVNCVLATEPMPPFVTRTDAEDADRRLSVIADVTCDVGSELNVLPVNTELTTWERPVRRLAEHPPLDVIAIDNLPSLLPVESSRDFSAALSPHLLTLGTGDPVWQRALDIFHRHVGAGATG